MRLGIRYRLLVPLALLLLGVVAVSLWSANVAARQAERRVASQLQNIVKTLENSRFPLTMPVIDQMRQLSGAEFLVVLPDGRRLSTFVNSETTRFPEISSLEKEGLPLGPPVRINGEFFRVRRLLLKEPHEQAGSRIDVFYPESLLSEVIWDAERPSFFGLLFGLVAVALTFVIADRLVRRIRVLEKRTRDIAGGDFSPLQVPTANDELRDLVVSVNEMVAQLANFRDEIERNERFRFAGQIASGLAHQLRNGVTGAQLALDIYLAESDSSDIEAIEVAKRQLKMMEVNLRRFIDLNRNESKLLERCDLAEISREVIGLFDSQAKHAHIRLDAEFPDATVVILGDSASLHDIVSNLVGNAIQAVGQNGEVIVQLKIVGQTAELCVSDTGQGPSPEIAPRLFDAFVTSKPEGIGLGLAVVQRAVKSHRGEIDWYRENHRTIFRVRLPIDR